MSLKDQLDVYATGVRGHDSFGPYISVEVDKEAAAYQPPSFGMTYEYDVRVQIGVRYKCNDAQKPEADRIARGWLFDELYREQLPYVNALKSAIFAGDKAAALSIVDKLEASMRP